MERDSRRSSRVQGHQLMNTMMGPLKRGIILCLGMRGKEEEYLIDKQDSHLRNGSLLKTQGQGNMCCQFNLEF